MRRSLLVISALAVVAVVGWVAFGRSRVGLKERSFDPVAAAKTRLEEARGEGIDLSRGPCLGTVGADWVVDVVHDPRQPVDDDPANQCDAYRTGRVMHFVELTLEGKVIRAK